jgi:hypothetical protein
MDAVLDRRFCIHLLWISTLYGTLINFLCKNISKISLAFAPVLRLNTNSRHRVKLHRDAEVEKFYTKTKFKKQLKICRMV